MPTLLIGAPTRGLPGVDADLDAVAAVAPALGLDAPVVLRDATLAAVRRRLAEMLAQTRPGAPVFLYLSGHGGFVTNRGYRAREVRPAPQRLVYFLTMPGPDGREEALFDAELSVWCARLAERSPNVVVVVDSCFSSGLVRDADAEQAFIADFSAWRDEHQDEIDRLDVEAHPDVVRLSAAGVNGFARPGPDGSALTVCMLAALAEAGALESSWLALFDRIEARLARAGVVQQPRLSGPVRRRPFRLAEALPPGAFPVRREGRDLALAGGAAQGVVRGDLFLVVGAGPERWAEAAAVGPASTLLRREPIAADAEVTPAAFAMPLRLRGPAGAAERSAAPREDGRSDRLQDLGAMPLSALGLRVAWGRVRAGVCERLEDGAELRDGERIFVRIDNVGDERRFVSVFWVGDDGEGALLSRSESMGVELADRTVYLLGDRPFTRAVRGVELPRRRLMPGERRREHIVVVATTRRQALWNFDTVRAGGSLLRSADPAGTETLRFTVTASDLEA